MLQHNPHAKRTSRDGAGSSLVGRLALWSGITAALAAAAFPLSVVGLSLAGVDQATWAGDVDSFARAFDPLPMVLPVAASLLIAPAFLALVVAVHYHAEGERRAFTQLATLVAAIYAGTVGINYLVQLAMVRNSLLAGDTEGMRAFLMENPHSFFSALEGLGYGWQGLAVVCMAMGFPPDRSGLWIRWLAAGVAVASIMGVAGVLMGLEITHPVMLASGVLWLLSFAPAMVVSGLAVRRGLSAAPLEAVG